MYIMSAYYPPRENVPIFDASLFSTENDGSQTTQSVSSSVINLSAQSITITPSSALDLNNPATFSFIKNNYGSNSALPVSVFSPAPLLSTDTIYQWLCEISWGSNAIEYGDLIQFRYTNSVWGTSSAGNNAYCWDNGTFFISPVLLNNASIVSPYTANTSEAVATTGDSGFFMTSRDTGTHQPALNPDPYTGGLGSVPLVFMEYVFNSNTILLYCKNYYSAFPSFASPAGNLVETHYNFNIEVLNNSGARVSTPQPFSTAMVQNTTRIVVP